MAKEITTANFETEVLKSEKPVLIDFWATWCGPCMRQGPVVEELAEEGYAVGKVDVDQNMALAQQFRVVSIPTLILFKDGAEVKRFVVCPFWSGFQYFSGISCSFALSAENFPWRRISSNACNTSMFSSLPSSASFVNARFSLMHAAAFGFFSTNTA